MVIIRVFIMDIIRVRHVLSFRHNVVIPLAILGFFQNFARCHVVPEHVTEVSRRMGHRSQLFCGTSQKEQYREQSKQWNRGIDFGQHHQFSLRTRPEQDQTMHIHVGFPVFPTASIEINQIPSIERLSAPSPNILSSLNSSLRIKTEKHNPSFISSLKGFLKTPIISTRLNSQMIALLKIRFNSVLTLAKAPLVGRKPLAQMKLIFGGSTQIHDFVTVNSGPKFHGNQGGIFFYCLQVS